MQSSDLLAQVSLRPAGPVSAACAATWALDFRSAAAYVQQLPYGRNANPADMLAVLREGRGTCSTKHALLRRLALELDIEIALVVGIYEMTEQNTPGIGKVLARYGLGSLPEAHCYLRSGPTRIDVTRRTSYSVESVYEFLYEEEIAPDQTGAYKKDLHRRFLLKWMERSGLSKTHTLEELWGIRELCIGALELA